MDIVSERINGRRKMVRYLGMRNGNNELFSFMSNNHFGYNVNGLGSEFDNQYIEYDGYFRNIKRTQIMSTISLDIAFGDQNKIEHYYWYKKFVDFLNVGYLKFVYIIDDVEYTCKVDLKSLSKSEAKQDGFLHEQLVLNKTSPWFEEVKLTLGERTYAEGSGKIYTQDAGYVYGDYYGNDVTYPTEPSESVYISDNSLGTNQTGIGCEIMIKSLVDGYTNPKYEVYNESRNIRQTDGYNVTLNAGDYIRISSLKGHVYCLIYQNGSREGIIMMDKQMRDVTGFVRLYEGKNTIRSLKTPMGEPDSGIKIDLLYRDEKAVM